MWTYGATDTRAKESRTYQIWTTEEINNYHEGTQSSHRHDGIYYLTSNGRNILTTPVIVTA